MSYRPICDVWWLARSKVKYYGAYPAGYLERARALLGVGYDDAVLHVCSGRVREYPFPKYALGPYDKTVDADLSVTPDYHLDVETAESLPSPPHVRLHWDAVLADPAYTNEDQAKYAAATFPSPNELLKKMLAVVKPGGRCGMLHYIIPRPPKGARFVASVAVMVGFGNRVRVFSVFERPREGK